MEYKYYKTVKKTASENSSLVLNGKDLFDFSLLDSMDISEREKDVIKNHALKYVSVAFCESMYGQIFDAFSACDGVALYHKHRVYNQKTGKRLYVLFELARIKHNSLTRKSVYDKFYDCTEHKATNDKYEPEFDIEL